MPAKAYQYQKEGVLDVEDFLDAGGGALLADDMGLGKTLQALWLLCRQRLGGMFPALVVCPASVKYMWEHEALEHVRLRAQVLEGRTPPAGRLGLIPKLMIINPDILMSWLPYLCRINLQTLVLDECQYFTNPRAKRTKAAIDLARRVPYRVALSGTPLTNRPAELFPTLHMLRPDVFRSFYSYAHRFCNPRRTPWGWDYKGAENIPQLHALLKRTCMVRRLKEDVLKDLPAKVRRVVPMDLVDRNEYAHASADFVGWLRKNYDKSRLTSALRAAAVTRIGYLLRLAARLKARNVVEWANEFLSEYPDEKLVLFAVHQKMIGVLQRRVKAKHITVDGNVVGRRRKLAVDQFRKDKQTRLFIGNIKAAGTGVDGLQEVCSTAAFCELWWRPGDHIQAEDRIHRIGQDGVAWVNYLVAGGTIEEDLCRIIQTKQEVIRATLDGQIYDGDMDVFNQLIEVLENGSE
ncbi:DEAD/DEAH box helicase [Patescibacteria group bacterium]|nr:DEAD/DEAH box helicase [Patescibacteria group bacterium]